MVIWQAARVSSSSEERADGYRLYTPRDEAFFAILGSVNGANTMRILIDYKGDIDFKTGSCIVVFLCRLGEEDVEDPLWLCCRFPEHR